MELKVKTPTFPEVIEFNFEELKQEITERSSAYVNLSELLHNPSASIMLGYLLWSNSASGIKNLQSLHRTTSTTSAAGVFGNEQSRTKSTPSFLPSLHHSEKSSSLLRNASRSMYSAIVFPFSIHLCSAVRAVVPVQILVPQL